jgi:beta-mannosidase
MRIGAFKLASLALILFAGGSGSLGAQQNDKTLWSPYYIGPKSREQHIPLNGTWQLGYRDTAIESLQDLDKLKWIGAEVPNSAQWALYQAGVLPYPYAHLNTRRYAWVPDKVWYYRRQFEVPASAQDHYLFLCFDGVGYYSRIWLNGTLVGRHEGMFGGPHAEVSHWVHFDQPNQITVEVKAGSYGVEHWNPEATGKVILPWGLAGGNQYVTTASGIEPKEIEPLGIWQTVRLEIAPKLHLQRPFMITERATEKRADLRLNLEVLANTTALDDELHPWKETQLATIRDSWAAKAVEPALTLQIELADGSSSQTAFGQRVPLRVYEGRNWITREITVFSPKLWWPNGMGAANLYHVSLTLMQQEKAIDRLEFEWGIRTIERVPTPGPRTQDRWADWQLVVNGRPLFVKGVNWAWPLDVLLHCPEERYRWLLRASQAAGIQMIRVWGGGNPETDEFYELCDYFGIMVWEDFPIGNTGTPGWPQDVWESQVLQTVFRLRNHPSLAIWCGGNEFNPYAIGNTGTVGIMERSVNDFDGTRMFLRTTPDPGDAHIYTDMDPTWYGQLYQWVPFISETGIFNMPEPASLLEIINPGELNEPLLDIFSKDFARSHPEFIHHLPEYQGQEPRTLINRASQMDDMSEPDLKVFCDATQAAAAEFTQILSDLTQANYPRTAGLMPWSLTVPWPMEFFMLIDGLDQPTPSYYALKRTYEPTHIVVKLPGMLWAKGETVPISISVVHAPPTTVTGLTASARILDSRFRPLWREEQQVALPNGPSVTDQEMGEFTVPDSLEDRFFFLVAELKQADGRLLSRSVYWPRCLKLMSDSEFRVKYRHWPQPSLKFEHGPWLRPQVAATRTSLQLSVISRRDIGETESSVQIRIRNTGPNPAFNTHFDIAGTRRSFIGTDSDFWLAPGEERVLEFDVLWRDAATRNQAMLTASAWNAATQQAAILE